ncbi:MAG: hypothetical protein JW724_03990 [Candidatus Altiarchaeota archaeon]|nr:hypothetical protein [Candidatus Altiarchaeota archaeon]
MDYLKNLLRSVRIWVLIISVAISLMLVCNLTGAKEGRGVGIGNGLSYGLDIAGGTEMWLRVDNTTTEVMDTERAILENRLNAFGLKDIPVNKYGDQYIVIRIANASREQINSTKNVLNKQANFEQRIDGEFAVNGSEINVDLSTGASRVYETSGGGFGWYVNVKFNTEGACRFGRVAQGKFYGEDNPSNSHVDLYIDRPDGTVILMTESLHGFLANITSTPTDRGWLMIIQNSEAYALERNTSFAGMSDDIYFGDTVIEVIENRSRIPVVVLGADANETLKELAKYRDEGYANCIIAEGADEITENTRNLLEDIGVDTVRIGIGDKRPDLWVREVTGLKTSPMLNFDTRIECADLCCYGAQITGGARTKDEAEDEVMSNKIWLTSGNLPAKVTIESEYTVDPSLGEQFLTNCLIIGILGVLSVSLVVFMRYRKLYIVVPTVITGFSEIVIILGVTTLIGKGWELDLPAIAGIIAAVGTGVDSQIVITDETIEGRSGRSGARKVVSLSERIRRAFFVIFTSAATIIAIMLPLMTFVAGTLKGFALVTILGVLIGIFITRPAYARIIEELIKRSE